MTATGTPAELRVFEQRGWTIVMSPAGLDVITAERSRDHGRSLRYLVARTAAELAAKLETADSEGSTP